MGQLQYVATYSFFCCKKQDVLANGSVQFDW